MAITRANAESILVKRCGPVMTQAGMDGTTDDGTNADLNDPIGWAVRQLGYTVADITNVADTDLDDLGTDEYDEFLDLAEYRTLETVLGNLDDVDLTVGPRRELFSQLAEQIRKKLERLQARLARLYGYGEADLEAGYITLSFAEHDDDSPELLET